MSSGFLGRKNFEVSLRSEFRRKWRSKNTSKWILESKWWFMGRFAHWERFIWRLTSSVKDFQCIAQGHQSILTHCFIIMALGLWQHVRRFHFLLPLLSSLFYYHKLRSTTHTNNTHAPNLFKAIATLIQARFRLHCKIRITLSFFSARCARPWHGSWLVLYMSQDMQHSEWTKRCLLSVGMESSAVKKYKTSLWGQEMS